ncbi:DoxX family protein [Sphingomonas sp. MG17]|uniref:DoxX family protein n=1 Tax=Sphingomonas tagetis TaxID=2949092 RepID=A0A9X2HK78_9SPHN|nr:DoxX family protein [Sphingomonas tagetis]MCP3730664.1 DoxX family protein [Sphingomonas tagetis]
MPRDWLLLAPLARGGDAALLAARLVVGAFLIWGVWDNLVSAARMAEFTGFLAAHGFAMPAAMARLSVYAQFLVGVALIAGFATRWAGLVCAFNFIVALWMVDAPLGIRPAFPATALVLFGLIFATIGAGRLSIDSLLARRPSA